MKLLSKGVALAVVSAGLFAQPIVSAGATPTATADNGLTAMTKQADGQVTVSKEPSTGKAGFIRSTGDLLPAKSAGNADAAAAKADAYLAKYGNLLGADASQLKQARVESTKVGWTVTYQQQYRGVPVFGAAIKANLDKQGDLTAVGGFAAPDLSVSTTPAKSADQAAKAAIAMVRANPPKNELGSADTASLRAEGTRLVIYRKGSVRGETGASVLAWQVDVTNVTAKSGSIRDTVLLDSTSLKTVNRFSTINEALDRELYTVVDDGGTPNDTSDDTWDLLYEEGGDRTGLDDEQNNLLDSTEEIYNLYRNLSGRDSYDNAGGKMIIVHNRADRCPNASWNGEYTSYCDGVYDDDTVAHEWSHAYTQYTSGLIYQWQSGALNESMSDVFGETVDLVNGREDEGEGDLSKKRSNLCSTHSPADPLLTINAPADIAKDCLTAGASFGRPLTGTGVTGNVIAPTDAVEDGGTDLDGCSPYNEDVTGKVVLVNRGLCSFESKAKVATDEGAVALIIGNREAAPIGMPGADKTLVSTVSIGLADRQAIRTKLAGGSTVNVTMRDIGGDREDSHRWLLSEKSSAFGGAIRDMWMPTCHGDPGKVSDAEYKCGTDDGGGVHSNSGVPNHAFALAVDGGTYNGQTTTGIGIDKAVNLWWRAQSAYLTPTSNFTDLADGLQASCTDLTGKSINAVKLGTNEVVAATPITATDCGELAKVIAATELRKEPVQCEFVPMLDPKAPALCGDAFVNETLWSEDFEDGLAGWTASHEVVYPGGIHAPWEAKAAGAEHNSKYAFGPTPDEGKCTNGAGDFSSRDSITSQVIDLGDTRLGPKLTFDHSVSTELGYDGGNVKISVNGGAFTVIPATAYLYNAPGKLASAEEQNTSPLAGQEGFTGTDGGTLKSGWGTSVVDLARAGVAAGDTVQVRFDIGRDGCGGVLGWSVDNVKIVDCKLPTKIAAVHNPEPSTAGSASTAEVTVTRDGSSGGTPAGTVVVLDAKGAELGRADLVQGKASVPLPANLPVGTNTLTAKYLGSRTLAMASTTFAATVKGTTPGKVTSKTTVNVKPAKPKAGRKVGFVVKVEAANGSAPSGTVEIKVEGKTKVVKTASLKNGRAVLVLNKGLKPGQYKVVAVFQGSATVTGSRAVTRFWVRR